MRTNAKEIVGRGMKLEPELAARLQTLATLITRHAPEDGERSTLVPGLRLFRTGTTSLVQRLVLSPSFCVVAQGEKLAHAGEKAFHYGPGSFVASSIDMPVVAQVVRASSSKPYLIASFELVPHEIISVIKDANLRQALPHPSPAATFEGRVDASMLDVVLRTLSALDDPRDAAFLGPLLRRELLYRLVTGPNAFAVCQAVLMARTTDGIGSALDYLKHHFKESISIADLAKRASMSVSSLHHKFKATAQMGPLQYQKRLRLEEARRLLLSGLADATTAALDVGYESQSQFIREYRRLFGEPPMRDVKRMRNEMRAHAASLQDRTETLRPEAGRSAPRVLW